MPVSRAGPRLTSCCAWHLAQSLARGRPFILWSKQWQQELIQPLEGSPRLTPSHQGPCKRQRLPAPALPAGTRPSWETDKPQSLLGKSASLVQQSPAFRVQSRGLVWGPGGAWLDCSWLPRGTSLLPGKQESWSAASAGGISQGHFLLRGAGRPHPRGWSAPSPAVWAQWSENSSWLH